MKRYQDHLVHDIGLTHADRIRSLAKSRGIDTQILLTKFALEAAIRRIFEGPNADRFGVSSLKGGSMMFFSEGVDVIDGRATSDIDLQLAGFNVT